MDEEVERLRYEAKMKMKISSKKTINKLTINTESWVSELLNERELLDCVTPTQ